MVGRPGNEARVDQHVQCLGPAFHCLQAVKPWGGGRGRGGGGGGGGEGGGHIEHYMITLFSKEQG